MNIKVIKNISNKYNNINILVNSPKDTEQVQNLVSSIMILANGKKQIIGAKDNRNYILDFANIICFYSEVKNTYCKTIEGSFRIKERLYEIEDMLEKDFIRISNSCIINMNYVKAFDSNYVGTVEIIMKDKTKEYVPRRRVKEIIKKLQEWGNVK